jgi:hypothetical protein
MNTKRLRSLNGTHGWRGSAVAGFLEFSFILALSFVAVAVGIAPEAARAAGPQPVTHQHFNSIDPLLSQPDGGAIDNSQYRHPPSPICSAATSSATNVDTDCEGTGAHNETTIAVNPRNPLNQIAGANDYQARPVGTSGLIQYYLEVFLRAHVTFDGGRTWTTYPIDFSGYNVSSDPALAFDTSGNAYYAMLGAEAGQTATGSTTNYDLLVAQSRDGGETWSKPARVAAGSGSPRSVGIFNDKPYVAAWGNGNAIVAWARFNQGTQGSYISSPIYASVTHDGGANWSTPTEISGSSAFCIGATGDDACDQDQGAVPVAATDGSRPT